MELLLQRRPSTARCTIGDLYVDGAWECFTLEDVVRDEKIYGETAIPAGTYVVMVTYSPRFKKYLPEIRDVQEFSGVRIHSGNTDEDTEGCVLVGQEVKGDSILRSKAAFDGLFIKIKRANYIDHELITMEIKNAATD